MKEIKKMKIRYLIYTAILMALGLFLFKFIPMEIYGGDILFDAYMHITIACFILYALYLFIKDKAWRIPYFIFALAVLVVISIQRIIGNRHNDIGLLIGMIISILAIIIPRWKEVKKHLKF